MAKTKTPIVDKTGKHTHVWKNGDDAKLSPRGVAVAKPPLPETLRGEVKVGQNARLHDLVRVGLPRSVSAPTKNGVEVTYTSMFGGARTVGIDYTDCVRHFDEFVGSDGYIVLNVDAIDPTIEPHYYAVENDNRVDINSISPGYADQFNELEKAWERFGAYFPSSAD